MAVTPASGFCLRMIFRKSVFRIVRQTVSQKTWREVKPRATAFSETALVYRKAMPWVDAIKAAQALQQQQVIAGEALTAVMEGRRSLTTRPAYSGWEIADCADRNRYRRRPAR